MLHVSHIAKGIDELLLADLQKDSGSLLVFGYDGDDSKQLDRETLVFIDLHLNWLSKQIAKGEVPKGSLLDEVLNGNQLIHIDRQTVIAQSDLFDLVEHLTAGEEAVNYFLLKYSFYKVMVQGINRLLLSRANRPHSDEVDILTEEKKMNKALEVMDRSLQQKFPGVNELAFISGMSVTSFLEKFHAVHGETPFEYFKRKQMHLAVTLLKRGLSVKSISYNLGYHDPANFSRAFKNFYGKSPKHFQG